MAHAQKPDFVFPRNGRVHLNRWGHQFSRLLAAESCASAVVMLDTPHSEVVWEYWLPTPFASFPINSPPVRHRVPSGFKRTLPVVIHILQFEKKNGLERSFLHPTLYLHISDHLLALWGSFVSLVVCLQTLSSYCLNFCSTWSSFWHTNQQAACAAANGLIPCRCSETLWCQLNQSSDILPGECWFWRGNRAWIHRLVCPESSPANSRQASQSSCRL